MKKTVLKVSIHGDKCKRDILAAAAKLEGINELSIDGKKETLTIVGEVDPVVVVKQLRKANKWAEIVSVGPPKPSEKPAATTECTCCPPIFPAPSWPCSNLGPIFSPW